MLPSHGIIKLPPAQIAAGLAKASFKSLRDTNSPLALYADVPINVDDAVFYLRIELRGTYALETKEVILEPTPCKLKITVSMNNPLSAFKTLAAKIIRIDGKDIPFLCTPCAN
jgi:hypothetical protein